MGSRSRIIVALAATLILAIALALGATGTALAADATGGSLNDTPTAITHTNPGPTSANLGDPNAWWRDGWGNSLFPDCEFSSPISNEEVVGDTTVTAPVTGFLYVMDRSPGTVIDTTLPDPTSVWNVNWSNEKTGSLFGQTFDLQGIFDEPPIGGWPFPPPGASTPIEGRWYLHVCFADYLRYADRTYTTAIGYDGTKPTRPTAINVGSTGWTSSQRRKITWSGASDALSGLGAYVVTVTNAKTPKRVTLVTQPKPTPPGYLYGEPLETVTVENLGPGKNTIQIQAEDRATNLSTSITGYAYVDTDTPVVKITSPGSASGRYVKMAATVTDLAGIREVRFYVDGTLRRSTPTTPYSVTYDAAALANGTHTLQVQATDMYGHIGYASKQFTLDKTAPVLSSMSDGPDPFFPRLVNGYKDNSYVEYRISKGGTVTLQVMTGAGTVIQNITKKVGSGPNQFVWNGRTSKGVVSEGTYYYRLVATDWVGNQAVAGTIATTVRYYLVQRLSDNSVRLIPE